eukprot:scaffold2868_cov348-Pavlova_lutheri.AAC.16
MGRTNSVGVVDKAYQDGYDKQRSGEEMSWFSVALATVHGSSTLDAIERDPFVHAWQKTKLLTRN